MEIATDEVEKYDQVDSIMIEIKLWKFSIFKLEWSIERRE